MLTPPLRRLALAAAVIGLVPCLLVGPADAAGPRGPSAPLELPRCVHHPGRHDRSPAPSWAGCRRSPTTRAATSTTRCPTTRAPGSPRRARPRAFYTLDIDVSDGSLDAGDVTVLVDHDAARPRRPAVPGAEPGPRGPDPHPRTTRSSSPPRASPAAGIAPFVREFSLSGQQLRELPVPGYFDPGPARPTAYGTTSGFEAAAVTPDGQRARSSAPRTRSPRTARPRPPRRAARPGILQLPHRARRPGPRVRLRHRPVVAPSRSSPSTGWSSCFRSTTSSCSRWSAPSRSAPATTIRIFRVALPGATNVSGVADLAGRRQASRPRSRCCSHLPARSAVSRWTTSRA